MKKKWKILLATVAALVLVLMIALAAYPHIEIQTEDNLIAFRYSDDISEFEDELSLDERYTYYADRDISITGFDFHKFLWFHVLIMEYEEGNLIESQYVLEETYIQDFITNAVIEENPDAIDLAALIEDKTPVVSNTRYVPEDYDQASSIFYTLHDESQVMLIYEVDDLLVIQIGYPDEGPKYIAYQ